MSLRELYQEMIVDHGKSPRNFGKLSEATHLHAGHNPLCGDQLIIYLILQKGVIEEAQFEGTGCAISVASSSLMIEVIKGKTVEEVEELFKNFHGLVTDGKAKEDVLGKLVALSGVAQFPIRVKCATLPWHTLKAALCCDQNPVSTE